MGIKWGLNWSGGYATNCIFLKCTLCLCYFSVCLCSYKFSGLKLTFDQKRRDVYHNFRTKTAILPFVWCILTRFPVYFFIVFLSWSSLSLESLHCTVQYSVSVSCSFLNIKNLPEILTDLTYHKLLNLITPSICLLFMALKGQCHEMVVEVRPWSGRLGLN
jgi:hypothetical protein